MEILYNDERWLKQGVDWLLCWDGIINVDILEHFARYRGYGGCGDEQIGFTYTEEDILEIEQDGISFPKSEGKVCLIYWKDYYFDEIDAVVLYDADVFYQYLKQRCMTAALLHPFQLKRIITSLAKIKHDLKLDQ